MKLSSKELKTMARQTLMGHYTTPILATLVLGSASGMMNSFSVFLFSPTTTAGLVMSEIFTMILSLILSIFTTGLTYMYMNLCRRKSYGFGDLVFLLKHHPDRIIAASFILYLITTVCSLPMTIAAYRMDITDISVESYGPYLACALLSLVLITIITLPFSLLFNLLADNLEMGALTAIRESFRMMKGNMLRYLYLQLSFLGLLILSVLSCYIALLWVSPYMAVAQTYFYLELTGELSNSETSGMD